MKNDNPAIIIPIYKRKPTFLEIVSLERMVKVFQHRKIFIFAPRTLDTSWYEDKFNNIEIVPFDDESFSGLDAYNRLLLSVYFYQRWSDVGFDYILVCQPDVYAIADRLDDFLCMPYDYIGAPLFRLEHERPCLYGGNGGFSLRKLESCIRVLKAHSDILATWRENEDEFFSHCGELFPDEFRTAPPDVASGFAFDRFSRVLYQWNHGGLPVAIHGWCTYDPFFSSRIIGLTDDETSRYQIEDVREKEEKRCLSFVRDHQPVILYGAGLWGKVFLRYFQRNHIPIRCFAVSDNQSADLSCLGVPVKHLSEIPEKHLEDGLVISISKRFVGEQVFADILENVRQRGFLHCFATNVVLFNLAAESWMKESYMT